MMRLDEMAEFFGLDEDAFEDDDVDTIGGMVVKLLGRIAQVNDTATLKNLTFIVKEIEGARITKLEIIRKPVEAEQKEEEQAK